MSTIYSDSVSLNKIDSTTTGQIANGDSLSVAMSKVLTNLIKLNKPIYSNSITITNLNTTEDGYPDNGDSLSVILSKMNRIMGEYNIKADDYQQQQAALNKTFLSTDTLADALKDYVKQEPNKGLSTNDFTDELKDKINSIPVNPNSNSIILTNINPVEEKIIDNGDSLSVAISVLMHDIQVLKMNDNTTNQNINDITDKFVLKVTGKDLSSNDFTNAYRSILDNVQTYIETKELDTNHVTLVNTSYDGEEGAVINGDKLSVAISKMLFSVRKLQSSLRDEYLNRGQLQKQYYHKEDGKGLTTNDFTDAYKKKIDDLLSNNGEDNTFFYTKDYINAHFVKIVNGKDLSSNDFTNSYKADLDALKVTYLALAGGTMKGNIDMNTQNITFTTGKISFLDPDGNEVGYLTRDYYPGTAEKANQVGNIEVTKRSYEYKVGNVAFPDGLTSGKYIYCTQAGTSAVLEPVWNDTPGKETIDGTVKWQTRDIWTTYDDDGNVTTDKYLALTGGTMKGAINMATNDITIDAANKIEFTSGDNSKGTITVTDYSGNAASANKLKAPVKINSVDFDGSKNIDIDCIPSSQKGKVNGVASLDSTGRVPAEQLPSYVKAVRNVDTYADLPNPGEENVIYCTDDNNEIYRWSGVSYINVSPSSSNAEAAMKLVTARTIALTGIIQGSTQFDGSKDVSIGTTITPSGVKAGTYQTESSINALTINAEGRITKVGPNLKFVLNFSDIKNTPTTLKGYGITDAVTPDDVNKLVKGVYLPLAGGDMKGNITMLDAGATDTTSSTLLGNLNNMGIKWTSAGLYCVDNKNSKTIWQYEPASKDFTLAPSTDVNIVFPTSKIDKYTASGFRAAVLNDTANNKSMVKPVSMPDPTGAWKASGASLVFSGESLMGAIQFNPSSKSIAVSGGSGADMAWNDSLAMLGADNTFTGKNSYTGVNNFTNLQVNGEDIDKKYIAKDDVKTLLDLLFPVGMVLESKSKDFDPNKQYTGTTWKQMTAGLVLVSQGSAASGTAFTVDKTGGAETVVLTDTQVPPKPAALPTGASCLLKTTDPIPDGWQNENPGHETGMTYTGWIHITPKPATPAPTPPATLGDTPAAVGAHENMPPYEVVYRWERTA